MTRIEIELPDTVAREAQAAGLLSARSLGRLLENALAKRRAADYLLGTADEVAQAGIKPMSIEEITAEVKATRKGVSARAGRH